MQGTWMENCGGWNHKDTYRKKQRRKDTIKDKFSALARKYYDEERAATCKLEKTAFRIENDDLIFVPETEKESKREWPKKTARLVKFMAVIVLRRKPKIEYKILNSIDQIDRNVFASVDEHIYIYGQAIEVRTEFEKSFNQFSFKYYELETGKLIEDNLWKEYRAKKDTSSVMVTIYRDKYLSSVMEYQRPEQSSLSFYNRRINTFYRSSDTRFLYNKPVFKHQQQWRRNSSASSRFNKKYRSSMIRASVHTFVKKAIFDPETPKERIVTKHCQSWWW